MNSRTHSIDHRLNPTTTTRSFSMHPCVWALATAMVIVAPLAGQGADPLRVAPSDPAAVFPQSTLAYAEFQSPKAILNGILDHPLREKIESIPQVKKGLKSPAYIGFLAGVGFAESFTGMSWEDSLDTLAGKGLALGFDAKDQAAGGVFVSASPKKLPKLYRGLLRFANQGNSGTVKEGKYRELPAFSVGKNLYLVAAKDRIFASNKKEFVKSMADAWLDKPEKTLAASKDFQACRKQFTNKTGWVYSHLKSIRESGLAKDLFREKTENIGAEALVGGVLETLRHANVASVAFDLTADQIQLSFATQFDSMQIPKQRNYFFGTEKDREQFKQIELEDDLLTINAFRDIGGLWLSKEDLFDENHLSELSQADSTLSTLFSGLDFGEEILGATKPGFQILARNQDFSKIQTPTPDIQIPEFAFVFRLKDTKKIPRRFKIAYQSFVGFLNIQLAMQGNPQLELESETFDNAKVVSATYLVDEDKEYGGIINYNFSPSIAFAGEWFIISSTRNLAIDLAKAGPQATKTSPAINTSVELKGRALSKILAANSEQLIAQNMLEEGNDREDAKKQIDLLLEVVSLFKNTSIVLSQKKESLNLDFTIQFEK